MLTCAHCSPMIPLTPTLQVLSKPSFDAAAERAWQVLLDVGFVRACRHHWLPVRQWRWRVAPSAATTNPSSAVHMKCVRWACSALEKNCVDSSYKLGYTGYILFILIKLLHPGRIAGCLYIHARYKLTNILIERLVLSFLICFYPNTPTSFSTSISMSRC